MKTPTDLLTQLEATGRDFTHAALLLESRGSTIAVFAEQTDRLEALNGANRQGRRACRIPWRGPGRRDDQRTHLRAGRIRVRRLGPAIFFDVG